MDVKCCEELGEKNTAVEIINSINVSRYTNEDKSTLYFRKYKNGGGEYFYNLSKSLYVTEDHKKKELEDVENLLKTTSQSDSASSLLSVYQSCLVELINDLTVAK